MVNTFEANVPLSMVYSRAVNQNSFEHCYFVSHGHRYDFQGVYVDVKSHREISVWLYTGKQKVSVFCWPVDELKYHYQYV